MNTTKKLAIAFEIDEVVDAINYLYSGKGTLANPLPIDNFITNDLKGLREIDFGDRIIITLDPGHLNSGQPKFCYCQIQNITKNSKNLITKKDWSTYYQFEDNDENSIVAPDGSLFITPINNQINITTAKAPKLMGISFVYFSYTLVIDFTYDNKKYYFIVDPFAKVSSKH